MRLFISGQKAFAASVFHLVRGLGHDVAGVAAPALDSTGQVPDRLRAAAERADVPWLAAERLTAAALPPAVDLIIAAHSHAFIGRPTRSRARLGAIGYHPSLLPRHRGRDAVRWTVHMGDPVAGGSIYWLSDAVDGGDLAAQDFVHVAPGETPERLWREKLAPMGLRLFEAVLGDLEAGLIRRQPQDERCATWEPSWARPPVHRPELLMLGALPDGMTLSQKAVRGPSAAA